MGYSTIDSRFNLIAPEDYGAKGDLQSLNDGAMDGVGAVLTSPSGPFQLKDVGKRVQVKGAGAAGASLTTTVAGFISPTQLELAANSQTPVAGTLARWGTNDQGPMAEALAALDVRIRPTLQLASRQYLVDGLILPTDHVSVVGFGKQSGLATFGDVPILDASMREGTIFRDFSFLGSADAALSSQIGLLLGTIGVPDTGVHSTRIFGVDFIDIGGDGCQLGPTDSTDPDAGPQFYGCRWQNCQGRGVAVGKQYTTFGACVMRGAGASGNDKGLYIAAGNVNWTGGHIVQSHFNVWIDPSFNDAHGLVSDAEINHGFAQVVRMAGTAGQPIVNPFSFVGCTFFVGLIWLQYTNGVLFDGNIFNVSAIRFEGSQGTKFGENGFAGNPSVQAPNRILRNFNGAPSTEIGI